MCSVTIAVTARRSHRGIAILSRYVNACQHTASQLLMSCAHTRIDDVDVDTCPREHAMS